MKQAIFLAVLLTACTGPDEQQLATGGNNEIVDCRPAEVAMSSIALGLYDESMTLESGAALALDPPVGQLNFVVAARLSETGQIGVWAIGSLEGAGPLWAVDSVARSSSDWGAAATPGSPADAMRSEIAQRDEAALVLTCPGV